MVERARISPGTSWRSRVDVALWIMPTAFVVGAGVLAFLTDRLDQRLIDSGRELPWLLNRGDVDDLRVLSGTVAGASISTLALVLSLTMVVMSNASTQFGPRLVRSFLRRRATKVTISVFTGLFVFSLLVLDSATSSGSSSVGPDGFRPEVGGTVVLAGAIAAVCCLIWYVQDIASSIQLPAVLATTVAELRGTVERLAADVSGDHDVELGTDGADVEVGRTGYVQQIERRPIVEAAARAGAVVQMTVRAGDFVVEGEVIARVHPGAAVGVLRDELGRRVDVGPHRTLDQDVQLAVDNVVEVALRALSPGINDTFTGLACLDWLADALITLAGVRLGRAVFVDPSGAARLIERQRTFTGIVASAYEKIRQSAVDNPAVAIRLVESITRVAAVVPGGEAGDALLAQATACVAAAAPRYVELDRAALLVRYDSLCERLGRPGDIPG
ncbi:MAG: DUF2254 domain-containing protein [Acidimicrobiales bacterium]